MTALPTEPDIVFTELRALLTEAVGLFLKPPKGMGDHLVVPDFVQRCRTLLKKLKRAEDAGATDLSELKQLRNEVAAVEQRNARLEELSSTLQIGYHTFVTAPVHFQKIDLAEALCGAINPTHYVDYNDRWVPLVTCNHCIKVWGACG